MNDFISGNHTVDELNNDPMINFAQSVKKESLQLREALVLMI